MSILGGILAIDITGKLPEYMYRGLFSLTEIQRKAVDLELKEIMSFCWEQNRKQQGLCELLKGEHDDKFRQKMMKKLDNVMHEHMFWLLVLEKHIGLLVLEDI